MNKLQSRFESGVDQLVAIFKDIGYCEEERQRVLEVYIACHAVLRFPCSPTPSVTVGGRIFKKGKKGKKSRNALVVGSFAGAAIVYTRKSA